MRPAAAGAFFPGYVLSVPSAFSLHRSRLSIPFALSPLRAVALEEGRLPMRWDSIGAHGVSGGSTYIALHRSSSVSVIWPYAHWSSGRCFILPARRSACIHGDKFVSLTGLCVSQPQHSHRVVLLGHLKCRVTGLT